MGIFDIISQFNFHDQTLNFAIQNARDNDQIGLYRERNGKAQLVRIGGENTPEKIRKLGGEIVMVRDIKNFFKEREVKYSTLQAPPGRKVVELDFQKNPPIIPQLKGTKYHGEAVFIKISDTGPPVPRPEGVGELEFSNHAKFVGKFVAGKPSEGILIKNGVVYTNIEGVKFFFDEKGQFCCPHCSASDKDVEVGLTMGKEKDTFTYTLTDDEGNTYSGEWEDRRRQGQGTMHYKDGEVFEGHWVNDLRNGYGIAKYKDGSEFKGIWFQGMRYGGCEYTYANGDKYSGSWRGDHPDGFGTLKTKEGEKTGWWYKGAFLGESGELTPEQLKELFIAKEVKRHYEGGEEVDEIFTGICGINDEGSPNQGERVTLDTAPEPFKQSLSDFPKETKSNHYLYLNGQIKTTHLETEFIDGVPQNHGVLFEGATRFAGGIKYVLRENRRVVPLAHGEGELLLFGTNRMRAEFKDNKLKLITAIPGETAITLKEGNQFLPDEAVTFNVDVDFDVVHKYTLEKNPVNMKGTMIYQNGNRVHGAFDQEGKFN